jgi:hypothetical protein
VNGGLEELWNTAVMLKVRCYPNIFIKENPEKP